MASKRHKKPDWWKNSFFWFAGVLFILAIVGLIGGENAIRDPGQVRESGLVLFYVLGSAVMFVQGIITQQQAVRAFTDEEEE